MRKRNGFTLIELLAVIIILGILMILAVPAVTKYINDSRKATYVSSAKNIAGGARNLVNSGSLKLDDQDTTYYIDGKCIKTDNAYKSPYGDFEKAYVVVTADYDGHDYYWTSVDETGTGVESIKKVDKLETKDIVNGIDIGEIDTNIGIDKRKNIVVVGGDGCTKSEPKLATRKMNSTTGKISAECTAVTETIYWALQNTDSNNHYQKLVLSDSTVSGGKNGSFPGNSVFSWANPTPWNGLESYITEVEIVGNIAPLSTTLLFSNVGQNSSTFSADLRNLEVCNVTNMRGMFYSTGMNSTTFSLNLSGWETSNVTDMNSMFNYAGSGATSWNVEGLELLDTSSVTDMSQMFGYIAGRVPTFSLNLGNYDVSSVANLSHMFYNSATYSTSVNLNLKNWDTKNVTNMISMFESFGENATSWNIVGLNGFNTSSLTDASYMFKNAAKQTSTINIDLANWNTPRLENILYMFYNFGHDATTVNINLSNWDTSNINYGMGYLFSYVGFNATTLNINISGWNMSNVEGISTMFESVGNNTTNFNIIIPRTNGNGINNSTDKIYGKTDSVYFRLYGREFTLAN